MKEVLSYATGAGGLIASGVAAIRYFSKKEQLEGDLKHLHEKYNDLNTRYSEVVETIGKVKLSGSAALLLRSEIGTQLELATKALQARASSVMVPLPGKNPSNLIFLEALGPVAHQLRRTTVPLDKGIAAHTFLTGRTYLAGDANSDKEFFKGIDLMSTYTTTDLLCVPVFSERRTIGVLQFLNKEGGPFTEQDMQIAKRFAESMAGRVEQFIQEPQNFELLGFAPAEQTLDGTVLFCDLTASSQLIDTTSFSTAVSLMNGYLEKVCDIAMQHGGTVDKFLGDGAMLRFNVPRELKDSRMQAVRAAVCMRESFEQQKAGWLKAGMPVSSLFTRIGVASGPLREAIMGHPQFQSLTVMGEPVVLASNLCNGAPRDRNVVLATKGTIEALDGRVACKPMPQTLLKKIKGQPTIAFEVLSCAARESAGSS